MSVQPGKAADSKPKAVDPANVAANLRDLTVHLHRGNAAEAKNIAAQAAEQLQELIQAGVEPEGRAQQTMFAIDEVRMLMSQRDFEGAATAARDAAKEWRSQPRPTPE